MSAEAILKYVVEMQWAIVALILALVFGKQLFAFLANYSRIEVSSEPIRLILQRLEEDFDVPKTQIQRLKGLTGHDLWALQAFVDRPDPSFQFVRSFNPQRKAMVYAFVEMGLLELKGDGEDREVVPTKLAAEVFEAADELL